MTDNKIKAGTIEQLHSPTGLWVFVDIGFSSKGKTCGILIHDSDKQSANDNGQCLTFGNLKKRLIELLRQDGAALHLVIEAPLSAAFADDGNPVGRTLERNTEGKTRYWYVGLGCSVLVAALYLIKAIADTAPQREVRIFEGFVSFKNPDKKSDHVADVVALHNAVFCDGEKTKRFIKPVPVSSSARIASTFGLLGIDGDPPPIVKAEVL